MLSKTKKKKTRSHLREALAGKKKNEKAPLPTFCNEKKAYVGGVSLTWSDCKKGGIRRGAARWTKKKACAVKKKKESRGKTSLNRKQIYERKIRGKDELDQTLPDGGGGEGSHPREESVPRSVGRGGPRGRRKGS